MKIVIILLICFLLTGCVDELSKLQGNISGIVGEETEGEGGGGGSFR